jgi:hypothetical protein
LVVVVDMNIRGVIVLVVSIVVLVISLALVRAPAILAICSVCSIFATKFLLLDRLMRLREDEFVAYVLPLSFNIRTVTGPRIWYAPPICTFYKFGSPRGIEDCVQKVKGTFSFTHVMEKNSHTSSKISVEYTVTNLSRYSMLRVDMMGVIHDSACHGRMEFLEKDVDEAMMTTVKVKMVATKVYSELFPTCQVCTERLYDTDLVDAISKLVLSFKRRSISDDAACKMTNAIIAHKLHNKQWQTS